MQGANDCGVFQRIRVNKLTLIDIGGFFLWLLRRLTWYVEWVFTRQVHFKKSDGLKQLSFKSGRMLTEELCEVASAVSSAYDQICHHICLGCLLVFPYGRYFVLLDEFLVLFV